MTEMSDLYYCIIYENLEWKRGGTWRERVTRTRTRITLILYNFPESSTFCEIFTFKFRSVYADCQRLWEIVKDSACTFLQIVEDCVSDCQRLSSARTRTRNSFSSFNPPRVEKSKGLMFLNVFVMVPTIYFFSKY